MGILKAYCHLLAKHPFKIIIANVTLISVLFIYTINKYPLPSFKEPLVGFEARATKISSRSNTYKLLLEHTTLDLSASSKLNLSIQVAHRKTSTLDTITDPLVILENSSSNVSIESETKVLESKNHKDSKFKEVSHEESSDDEEDYIKETNVHSDELLHFSREQSMFCGRPFDAYAHVVIDSTFNEPANIDDRNNSGMFTLESLLAICDIDKKLRLEDKSVIEEHNFLFERDCERYRIDHSNSSACCKSWSLPNYAACLANKTSCADLVQTDFDLVHRLFEICVPYFLQNPNNDCFDVNHATTANKILDNKFNRVDCNRIPQECKRCDNWIFSVMNYLVDVDFSKKSDNFTANLGPLRATTIFLPLAKSTYLLDYYKTLSNLVLKNGTTRVSAMNLGLKDSMFDILIANDTKLFILALVINLIIIAIYSKSIMISVATLCIICLSLCLSYVLYQAIGMPIFPFMNLLAVIISSGICPDNAMLFCKPWKDIDSKSLANDIQRIYTKSIKDTFIASPATTIALSASFISHVVAIKCFSVFAMLSVLTNYLLTVILLPPVLILEYEYREKFKSFFEVLLNIDISFQRTKETLSSAKSNIYKNFIYLIVVKFKITLISLFSLVYIISAIIVLYYPQFTPPDSDEFQLLSSDHPFEMYDLKSKVLFWFEKSKKESVINNEYSNLSIRIVFGVKSIDNGYVLDPNDRGSLIYDPKFNMSDPNAQVWMLNFCSKLRQQNFVAKPLSLSYTECFIETFKLWMQRKCIDPIIPEHNRYPCCEVSKFPYSKVTFEKCFQEAADSVQRTPHYTLETMAGPRFSKTTNKLAAIIIEYTSNQPFTNSYVKMNNFWNEVNDWVTLEIKKTAPASLKSGWFISDHLELFALQEELLQGTISTILLEIFSAMIALFIGTRDLSLCLIGSLAISTILTTTVALLISIGWSLNIVESICISLATGLSVDFALHNTISYKHSIQRSRDMTVSQVIEHVQGPISLATITTLVAGFTIIGSNILAYQQIGKFLMIIAITSWIVSTFFLLSLLSLVGPTQEKSKFESWFQIMMI